MKRPPSTAKQITRRSKSNLALGFLALPRDRRRDISVFYAFCRIVDDIVDEPGWTADQRRAALGDWRQSLAKSMPNEPVLASEVRELIAKYQLSPEHFHEIINGVEMDLSGRTYETWEELQVYCHRVASVVGLVSIEIFGYTDPRSRQYALNLGLALQLTNILRDVGEDYSNGGRVYLPRADMEEFGYTVASVASAQRDDRFLALMAFEAKRAQVFYECAQAALPRIDRRNLIPAEIMREIYTRLLSKMQLDGFLVFSKRYRLSSVEKSLCVLRVLLRSCGPFAHFRMPPRRN